jgi:predicted RNA-binding protein YlxR (DUF448 family)
MLAFADPSGLDNGLRTTKSATERMCAVTRDVKPIDEMIRFVLSPDGEAVPDLKRKLPGRGLWVTASHKTVTDAARKNVFARGFKAQVRPRPGLADEVDALLVRSALDALAMAGKAGQAVAGFAKVEAALTQRMAAVLVHASDGAPDGIRKLDASARANTAGEPIPVVTVLTSAELDLALGRSNVIHAALLAGPASKTFLSRCRILVRYRMPDGPAASESAEESN